MLLFQPETKLKKGRDIMKRKLFTLLTTLILTLSVGTAVLMQTADAMPRTGSGGHGTDEN